MQLQVNGQSLSDLPDSMSVLALLEHLSIPTKKVAVERNLEIVPKSKFAEIQLTEGDRLEIIHFIGGG